MELKIESGIQMPPARSRIGLDTLTSIRNMGIHDSILLPNVSRASAFISKAHRETSFRFSRRQVEGGYRVWRVK